MLCNYGLQDSKESVVLGEGIRCWGKPDGGADGELDSRRGVGKKRQNMAGD